MERQARTGRAAEGRVGDGSRGSDSPEGGDSVVPLPSPREMTVADLLAWSGNDRLDEVTAREASRVLRSRGLQARPDLFSVLSEQGEEHWEPAFDTRGLTVPGKSLEQITVTVSATRVPALLGVALVSALAASIAWYDSVLYGLLTVAAGVAAGVGLWRWFGLLDMELPAEVPRSGLLGAGLAALFIGATLVVIGALRWVTGL
jgi:hypothetical protein